MKKLLSTLLALCLLLACVPAWADGAAEMNDLPVNVQSYLRARAEEDDYRAMDALRPGSADYYFVAANDGDDNRLLCFRLKNGEWVYQWNRTSPMPDVQYDVQLTDLSGQVYNGMQLGVAFSIRETRVTPRECVYELDGSVWKLVMVCQHDTDDTIIDTYRVEKSVVRYDGWRKEGQQRKGNGTCDDEQEFLPVHLEVFLGKMTQQNIGHRGHHAGGAFAEKRGGGEIVRNDGYGESTLRTVRCYALRNARGL